MTKKIGQIIKKIAIMIIVIFILILLIIDFNKFNNKKNNEFIYIGKNNNSNLENTQISGNQYLPDNIILQKLNQYYNKEINPYNPLIKNLKRITLSNKRKLILIEENIPLFHDGNYIYLSSQDYVSNSLEILNKENLAFLDLTIIDKKKYQNLINQLRVFANNLKANYEGFYNTLDSIVYNEKQSLYLSMEGCKVILADISENNLNQEELEDKIDILNTVINKKELEIDKLQKIDLTWHKLGVDWEKKI